MSKEETSEGFFQAGLCVLLKSRWREARLFLDIPLTVGSVTRLMTW